MHIGDTDKDTAIPYEELFKKYKVLERENKELRAQIKALTEKRNDSVKPKTITDNFENPIVTMRSTPAEKNQAFSLAVPRQR